MVEKSQGRDCLSTPPLRPRARAFRRDRVRWSPPADL